MINECFHCKWKQSYRHRIQTNKPTNRLGNIYNVVSAHIIMCCCIQVIKFHWKREVDGKIMDKWILVNEIAIVVYRFVCYLFFVWNWNCQGNEAPKRAQFMDKIFYQLLFFDFGSFFLLINFMARIEILVTKIVRPKNYYYTYYELCYAIYSTHTKMKTTIFICALYLILQLDFILYLCLSVCVCPLSISMCLYAIAMMLWHYVKK